MATAKAFSYWQTFKLHFLKLKLVFGVFSFALLSSCGNIFSELGDTGSDQALLYQAKMDLSQSLWTTAINDIGRMSASAQSLRSTQGLLASAYAGRCGLDAINVAQNLNSMGTVKFLRMAYNLMVGATAARLADCRTAEAILKTLGSTGALRTPNENMEMALLEIAKIGAILAVNSDPTGTGTPTWVAGGLEPCNIATGTPLITGFDLADVFVGMNIFRDSIVSSGIGSQAAALASSISGLCSSLPVAAQAMCNALFLIYDPNTIVATANPTGGLYRQLIRAMIEDGSIIGMQIQPAANLLQNFSYVAPGPNSNWCLNNN